jgi:hypothetical protein
MPLIDNTNIYGGYKTILQECFKELINTDLQALVDCGSTDHFLNLNLVENLKLEILPLKNRCVSLPVGVSRIKKQ